MEKIYVEMRDGDYWVSGSRVSLDSVVLAFLQGLSPETIAGECFSTLTLEQVYGAIAYYLAHRPEIDAYLKQADAESEAFRRAIHSDAPEFARKLAEARRQMQTAETTKPRFADLLHLEGDLPDAPTDLASQHDHYLYGTPKR